MWIVAIVDQSSMCTYKFILAMMSILSLEATKRCTFPAGYQWTGQCSGKIAFEIKLN